MAHNFGRGLFQIHDAFHIGTIAVPIIARKQFNAQRLAAARSLSRLPLGRQFDLITPPTIFRL